MVDKIAGEDSLYAVLDGHDGSRVAHFARETLIREYCSLIADGGDVNQILEQVKTRTLLSLCYY